MKKALVFALILMAIAPCVFAQGKVPAPKDQLYIEVSALGNNDYFYDHKLGMKMVGKELGVRTEYVGPAEYDMNAMVAALEQVHREEAAGSRRRRVRALAELHRRQGRGGRYPPS